MIWDLFATPYSVTCICTEQSKHIYVIFSSYLSIEFSYFICYDFKIRIFASTENLTTENYLKSSYLDALLSSKDFMQQFSFSISLKNLGNSAVSIVIFVKSTISFFLVKRYLVITQTFDDYYTLHISNKKHEILSSGILFVE